MGKGDTTFETIIVLERKLLHQNGRHGYTSGSLLRSLIDKGEWIPKSTVAENRAGSLKISGSEHGTTPSEMRPDCPARTRYKAIVIAIKETEWSRVSGQGSLSCEQLCNVQWAEESVVRGHELIDSCMISIGQH
ncbi:hypothetical protein CHS0354_027143 [Potamilus streckersoni]|uniref:Uncharacterized protein n=1 Tax=Potamilus streckersoni TaxID=2493646 RepID=A0AAE0W421_9BIVA|nr:hypothetical protein CHS0354_027143 [Potamilus streckersoni]